MWCVLGKNGTHFSKRQLVLFVVALGVVFDLFVTAYLWAPNLKSPFRVIDDHWVAFYLGPDRKINLSECLPIFIKESGATRWGGAQRFQPSWHFFHVLEAFLWQDSSSLWYGARALGYFFVFLCVCFFLIWYSGSFLIGCALTFCLMTEVYWWGIFALLGPAEFYSAIGICVVGIGCFLVCFPPSPEKRGSLYIRSGWILVILGLLLAMGSKENFLILGVLFVPFYFSMYRRRKTDFFSHFLAVGLVIFGLWIFLKVFLNLSKEGADFYSQDASLWGRLMIAATQNRLFSSYPFLCVVASLLCYGLGRTPSVRRVINDPGADSTLLRLFVLQTLIWGIYCFLAFFNGSIGFVDRYSFPARLLEMTAVIIFVYTLLDLIPKMYYKYAKILFVVLLLFVCARRSCPVQIRERTKEAIEMTVVFWDGMNQLIDKAKSFPDRPVVYYFNKIYSHYEPMDSITKYLRFYGVKNPVSIFVDPKWDAAEKSALDTVLLNNLKEMSKGSGGYTPTDISLSKTCIAAHLSGISPTPCADSVEISP